ncbi:MAG TPA: peptidylprolyl isomerase [Longimicrobiales bacterium]|nr:peptidylprolyl isomerase [Longimicrobiales bacterium]
MRFRFSTLLAGLLAAGTPLAAQQPERIGYIVAIVGDSAITNVALTDAVIRKFAQQQRQPVLEGPEFDRVRAEVLDEEITKLIVVLAAAKDTTISIDDNRVRQAVDAEIAQRQKNVGGELVFQQLLQQNRMTLSEFREFVTSEHRRNALLQTYVQQLRRDRQPPPASDRDIREFFEQNRPYVAQALGGERPPLVTLHQIVLPIAASDAALARARAEADSVRAVLRAGEDFEQAARRSSDDVASREKGGDLGYIRETDLVREFARVAFSMPPGQVSEPVRTVYGYHVIKVERVRGAERQIRHILFSPDVTDADVERTMDRADSIATALRAGADASVLARRYGDPEFDTRVGPIPPERYATTFGVDVSAAAPDEVIGPSGFGEGPGRRILVGRVLERTPAGEWSLEDSYVRDFVKNEVESQKLIDEVVAELRRATYVKILES